MRVEVPTHVTATEPVASSPAYVVVSTQLSPGMIPGGGSLRSRS